MKTTELTILLKKKGILNSIMAVIVAHHNEGLNSFTITDIAGYAKCKSAEFPFTLQRIEIKIDKHKITIMEDGLKPNIIIEEKGLI